MISIESLEKLKFIKKDITITINGGDLEYNNISPKDDEANPVSGVYMFLAKKDESNEQFNIIYIGKAGKGINKRINEHRNGYKRKVSQGKTTKGIQDMLNICKELDVKELELWYRESKFKSFSEIFTDINIGGGDFELSNYSLEEELLIYKFKDDFIVNRQIPNSVLDIIEDNYIHLNDIRNRAIKNTIRGQDIENTEFIEEFEQYLDSWNESTKCSVNNFFKSKLDDFNNLEPKFIGHYSSGALRNQPVIAFGKFNKSDNAAKFSGHTVKYRLSIDGKLCVECPNDTNKIIIYNISDYTSII